jgi:hypothetical protein
MTTNYPGDTPTGPVGPGNVPPSRDAAWGCVWWWWLLLIFIIILFWWAGWGWGPYGGYWFRTRPNRTTTPNMVAPNNPPAPPVAPRRNSTTQPATSTTGRTGFIVTTPALWQL